MSKYWDEIIDRVQIDEALAKYCGLRPNRSHFVCCPLHGERTASFSIKDNHWHCFGCGLGGNVINFVMQYFKLDFKTACIKLNEDFGLNLPIDYNNLSMQDKIKYKEQKKKEAHDKWVREQYIKWKNDYLNKNVDGLERVSNELKEFLPVLYKDSAEPYKTEQSDEIVVGGCTIKIPIPYHNFNSELIGDDDFDELVARYIHLVKVLKNIKENNLPSEEQLQAIYHSRNNGFYIN